MSETHSQGSTAVLASDDYEAIEAAVMETERGRWFLAEHARRNRAADTETVLAAIARLEANMPTGAPAPADLDGMKGAIVEMADEIAAAKREIAAIGRDSGDGKELSDATAELDAIVDATEGAASEILEAAEAVQELAWTLREEGVEDRYCDAFDMRATEIYTACSFQDITGQRTRKVVRLLQRLDDRISTLAGIWGGGEAAVGEAEASAQPEDMSEQALLNGPARAGEGVSQDDVDMMMVDLESFDFDTAAETAASTSAEPAPAAGETEPARDEDASPNGATKAPPGPVAVEPAAEPAAEPEPDTLEVPLEKLSQADKDALFA